MSRFSGALVFTALLSLAPAHAAFVSGDIFASVSNGIVTAYNPNGSFLQTLNTGLGGYTTGSASDPTGNFYVTDFSASAVSKFTNNGTLVGTYGSGYSTPEDLLFDSAGNSFVGNIGGTIKKFDSAGTLITTYNTPRTDWFDISGDFSTAYYTDEGGAIHRWNLLTNSAMTDLVSSGGQFAIRLLSDGNLLVASSSAVNEYNATTGAFVRTYTIANTSELFALNLDPDGVDFWTGDVSSGNLFKVNIASGAILETINTNAPGNLFGVSVYGEITQVGGTTPEPVSMLLFGTGLASLIALKRYRKAASR